MAHLGVTWSFGIAVVLGAVGLGQGRVRAEELPTTLLFDSGKEG